MEFPEQAEDLYGEEKLLGQFIPLHYHFNMLQDQMRTGAFRDAIAARVRPGMHVLELGGGTGVLSFFAAKMGANVTCVERNPALVQKARELVRLNQVDHLVQVVHDDAARFTPDKPVDLVVCEMLHVALLREKQLAVIDAFKQNYLAAGFETLPAFMPDSTLMGVQAIEFDFSFTGYQAPLPLFQDATAGSSRSSALTDLTPYATIFYEEAYPQRFQWHGRVPVNSTGTFNAVRFLTQNLLGQSARDEPVTWANQLLVVPLAEPCPVNAGQHVDIAFDYLAGQPLEALTGELSASVAAPVQYRRAA